MIRGATIITGASRGIGRQIALAFGAKKYRVGLNYLQSDEKARETAKKIRESGGEVLMLKADVSDPLQVQNMVACAAEKWGRIDVLVNNAGITRNRTILKMTDSEWNDCINTNLTGSFWCLRECAKVMASQKDGAIINISSIAGLRGGIGMANYSAAKAGLIGLTKTAARELGRFNVRVNALLPGFHRTDMGENFWQKNSDKVLEEHTLGKLSDMNELADFLLFLAEQRSVSGQVYNFDSRIV